MERIWHFQRLPSLESSAAFARSLTADFDNGWHTDWGWNAGGGLAWRFANKELFVESRVMGFTRRNDIFPNISWSSARQVPIVVGMNFY